MKTGNKRAEDPPKEIDPDAWRAIVARDRLGRSRPEDVVAAIQSIGPKVDKKLLEALMGHIADVITRLLRRRIGRHHPNEGNDIIDRDEIGAALRRFAFENDAATLRRYDVAGTKRGISVDVDWRQSATVSAIACAIGDDLFAIGKCVLEVDVCWCAPTK